MRKFIPSLVCTFFLIYIFSFRVSAGSLAVDPSTFAYLSEGAESLSHLAFFDVGIGPVPGVEGTKYEHMLAYVLSAQDPEYINRFTDLTPSAMPYEVIDKYFGEELYDKDGNLVSIDDTLYCQYCTFDNGYYHGSCLLDHNGYIIHVLDQYENEVPVADISLGGSLKSSTEMEQAFHSVATTVQSNGYNYSLSGSSVGSQATFYLCIGFADNSYSPEYAESVFIINQYLPGVIVPETSSNGSAIQAWYTNDLSLIQHSIIVGDSSDSHFDVTAGNYSKGNYDYSYRVTFWDTRSWNGYNIEGSLSDFLDGAVINSPVLARSGYTYSSSLYNHAVPFIPSQGDVISFDDDYLIDDVITGLSDVYGTDTSPSMSFDPTQGISVGNYPVVRVIDGTIVSDPSLPDESVEDTTADPDIDVEIPGILDIPEGGFDIPIVSNLQNRFPFSIPWDIKNLLKSLRAVSTAPRFQGELYIAPLNYTYTIDLDLSMFETQAEIFRTCFLITFIIGLAIFSYSHFFGH